MMNSKNFEVIIKLFGIYCFILFVSSISGVGMAFATAHSEYISNKFLYILMPSVLSALYLMLSIILLFKTQIITVFVFKAQTATFEEEAMEVRPYTRLRFWIILIGIFYFISAISSLISEAVMLSITQRGAYWWSKILSQVLILILSIMLIFKSKVIEDIIIRKSDHNI